MAYQEKPKPKDEKQLDLEGSLYASIATLDRLSREFNEGNIGESFYKRQIKGLIRDAFKARVRLEQIQNFSIEEFIQSQQLKDKFPLGVQKLLLAEGSGEEAVMPYTQLRKIPAKVAEFVSASIELLDFLQLRSVAKIEHIVPLLDDLKRILESFPGIPNDYWVLDEIEKWRQSLSDQDPKKLLEEEEIDQLGFQASRWLDDFRSKLKDM